MVTKRRDEAGTSRHGAAAVVRPRFMTSAMWYAWLLRRDIAPVLAIPDEEAQREFVVWWLLWGRGEYSAAWGWSSVQADAAMELVPIGRGLACPRLLRRLHASRTDLQHAFSLQDQESLVEYLCWYRVYGPLELDVAPPLPPVCIAMTESPRLRRPWLEGDPSVPFLAITLASRYLRAGGRISSAATRHLAEWYKICGRGLLPSPTTPPAPSPPVRRGRRKSGGVNVVGFVRGQCGLGEDVRMASAALAAAGVPHVLCDVPAGPTVPQGDDSLSDRLTERLPYKVTIYCMSAFDMAGLYLARGPAFFAGQYRIGYWPWELPSFPALWKDVYTLVDEVWAGSTFTAQSHRTRCPKPVHRLPCPVVLPRVPPVQRRDLGLHDEGTFVFVYPFDINSYLARKNPLGLIRAFRLAFQPKDKQVALLLRVNGNPDAQPKWADVVAECAADRRISVLAGTLDRHAALGVIAASDCLVSPHRAEGFGRNIAEAILLGVPVLATAFSGCMDFLVPEEGLPFEPTPLRDGDYPFGEGLWWAEPSIKEMARRMRQVRRAREGNHALQSQRLAQRRAELAAAYSPLVRGTAFAARLRQIERQTARLRAVP
jgi:glycosyltransferase involved in cell wall biosynthesis